jgi:hypothetical protein
MLVLYKHDHYRETTGFALKKTDESPKINLFSGIFVREGNRRKLIIKKIQKEVPYV